MTTTPAVTHRPPRARPAAAGLSVLLALVLVALAVVGVHDLSAARGWSAGDPWIPDLVDRVDGRSADSGVVAAAIAIAVIGLLLVLAAFAPARRTHLRVGGGDHDVWLSPDAVGVLARSAADRAPGVISAELVRSRRRRVTVEVVTQHPREEVTAAVRSALDGSLADLTGTRFTVRTTELPR